MTPPNLQPHAAQQALEPLNTVQNNQMAHMLGFDMGEAGVRDAGRLEVHQLYELQLCAAASLACTRTSTPGRLGLVAELTGAPSGVLQGNPSADSHHADVQEGARKSKARKTAPRKPRKTSGNGEHKHLKEQFGKRKSLASAQRPACCVRACFAVGSEYCTAARVSFPAQWQKVTQIALRLTCGLMCAAAGLQEVDGRRTSTRSKMKPLKWWQGEAKHYGRDHQSAIPTVLCVANGCDL